MNFSPHILIIDDNNLAIKLISNYLTDLKYTCIPANNGKEAFEMLSKYAFSLIICDLNMPVMDGYEFVESFRKQHEFDLIPIIVVSSDDKEENIIKILNSGADDFISKPLHENVFTSKIQALLQKNDIKKQKISSLATNMINETTTNILYCSSEETHFPTQLFSNSQFNYSLILNQQDLFNSMNNLDITLICVDENATWLFQIYQRFLETIKPNIPVVFLLTEGTDFPLIDATSGVLYKHFAFSYILHHFQFISMLQQRNKTQYISSLKRALLQSSFVFERYKEEDFCNFKISMLHENFEDIPGGDFYEVFDFQKRYKVIFMGDIMGKSWSAWMYVPIYLAYIRSTIKFLTSRNLNNILQAPEKILRMLNQYCAKDLQLSEVFTTLSLIVIDSVEEKIIISSAGGISPFFYNSETNSINEIELKGNLLGINLESEYIKTTIPCKSGDVCMFYSDGYSEAFESTTNQMIGRNKMKDIFTSFIQKKLQSSLDFETEYLNQSTIQIFNDDRSLLLLSRK